MLQIAFDDDRARGRATQPERFFDVLRAMLFYIDEFPERLHHPEGVEVSVSQAGGRGP